MEIMTVLLEAIWKGRAKKARKKAPSPLRFDPSNSHVQAFI